MDLDLDIGDCVLNLGVVCEYARVSHMAWNEAYAVSLREYIPYPYKGIIN